MYVVCDMPHTFFYVEVSCFLLHLTRSFVIIMLLSVCLHCGSVLDTVNLIIHKFGILASCYLPSLLQIVVCVAATSAALLNRREEIQKYHVNTLKSLQQKATSTMCDVCVESDFWGVFLYFLVT